MRSLRTPSAISESAAQGNVGEGSLDFGALFGGNWESFHGKATHPLKTAFEDHAQLYCAFVCCADCSRRGILAVTVATRSDFNSEQSYELTSRSARLSGGAHRPLSRPVAGANPGGVNLPARN